jgi:MinD superfamily P-loop ATPase
MTYELPVMQAETATGRPDLVRALHALHTFRIQRYIVIKRHGWRDIQVTDIVRGTHVSSTMEKLMRK